VRRKKLCEGLEEWTFGRGRGDERKPPLKRWDWEKKVGRSAEREPISIVKTTEAGEGLGAWKNKQGRRTITQP